MNRLETSGEIPQPRPRILYLVTRAERGGAQTHILSLAMALQPEIDVEVATGEDGFLTSACRKADIPVHIVPGLRRNISPFLDIRALRETIRLLRRTRPDLLHAHTAKAGMIGRLAARICGIPSIYTVHMWPFGPEVPASWRIFGPSLERMAARWSDRLITVSLWGAARGHKYRIADPSRIIPIHNGIPDVQQRSNQAFKAEPVVAMVARFSQFKDHETLLRAFARINAPARLLLVGDGPTRPFIEGMVHDLGIRGRVEFAGDRNDVPAILANADIFVLASTFEHLPISIIEAMRAGLPVIATKVGGVEEVVRDGQTGYLVERQSVSALQNRLSALIADSELRIRMGQAGRQSYEDRFLAVHMVDRTRLVYADVLSARHAVLREADIVKHA